MPITLKNLVKRLMYGSDGTDPQPLRTETDGKLRASVFGQVTNPGDTALRMVNAAAADSSPALVVVPVLRGSGNARTLSAGIDATDGHNAVSIMAAAPMLYNGSLWDRARSSFDVPNVLASQANTTATRTSADIRAWNLRGVLIHVKISSVIGTTGRYTLRLDWKCPDGTYEPIWQATAALGAANGDFGYLLYPGALGGNLDEVDGIPVPPTFRVLLVASGADASNNATTLVDLSLLV
jgi:hypothetical protein